MLVGKRKGIALCLQHVQISPRRSEYLLTWDADTRCQWKIPFSLHITKSSCVWTVTQLCAFPNCLQNHDQTLALNLKCKSMLQRFSRVKLVYCRPRTEGTVCKALDHNLLPCLFTSVLLQVTYLSLLIFSCYSVQKQKPSLERSCLYKQNNSSSKKGK